MAMVIKKEGILRKWTNYLGNWQNRYFVLENGILSYYKENPLNTKSSCRGAVCAYDANFKESRNFGLDIVLEDCSWFIRAKDLDERNQWMTAFQDCKLQKSTTILDENRNQLFNEQNPQVGLDNISRCQTATSIPPETSSATTNSNFPTTITDTTTRNLQTTKNVTSDISREVTLEDVLVSKKTLEEKAASWKEACRNGKSRLLLSKNPKDVFVDNHVPQALKCPICFEVFANIVYQCQEGHSVCSVCFSKITCCPLCQKRYGLRRLRNRLIEDLASTETMSCPGLPYGCQYKGNIKSMESHVGGCLEFVIGEKLAQETCGVANRCSAESLLEFPTNISENTQNPKQQVSNELNHLIAGKLFFFVVICGLLVNFLGYFMFGF